MPITARFVSLLLLAAGAAWTSTSVAEAIPVSLQKSDKGWQLLRGGEPYFIKGAGGDSSLELLVAAGGNSIRTWGADNAQEILDRAHALGLSVTVGIWLGHERHGFDYSDKAQVAKQLATAREAVLRYKDHPALLLWGVGNEMEGFKAGDNPLIWNAVNDVAAMIKELDPDHPTMVVTAEVGGERVKFVHQLSDAVDIHGINSYGGITSVAERLTKAGAVKPYVITEFGPVGAWEMPKTEWGAPIEQTSTEKAAFYKLGYETAVLGQPGRALGSYAFAWGFKMEGTATWNGMFLSQGSKVGAVDAMTELWSGKAPENLAPLVEPLRVDGPVQVKPGATVKVTSAVIDPDNDQITTHWVLRPESNEYLTGGDFRPDLPDIDGVIRESSANRVKLTMPEEPGPYRLFFYAYDEANGAATANVPLLVKGKVRARMPVVVYENSFEGMPWAPSGWMGNVDALTMDGTNTVNSRDGSANIRMRYTGKYNWVGVAWQHPANNWGDQDGGFNVSGATALEVWARGEYGGEKVSFGVGIISKEKAYPDSGMNKIEEIVLTDQWTLYQVPLRKLDLSSIKTGFYVTLTGRSGPITVYLDEIRFVR